MALGIAGVRVGTWTSPEHVTGCTVVLPPSGTVGAVAVRGASPGTREAAALGRDGKVEVCHAVMLAGSSAYGLDAAHGAMLWLEEQGIGYPVGPAVVPIVGGAIVLDAGVMAPDERPDAAAGRWACEHASEDDPPEGGVGVGTGCSVAKVGGLDHGWRSGQGIAVRSAAGVTVGALVANNAVGEVVDDDGTWVVRARVADGAPRFPTDGSLRPGSPTDAGPAPGGGGVAGRGAGGVAGRGAGAGVVNDLEGPTQNTAIGCIVTNARLTKRDAHRVADLGHGGLARALRPAHTQFDGDALFCLATGEVAASVDLVSYLAAEAVAQATRRGPCAAVGAHGLPGLADGPRR